MMNNNTPLLEMRNIKKDFFGNQVLTDINFTLNAGEVLGLVGENGAGKSTLMKLLFGMDVIRETGGYGGDVLINGEKVSFSTPFDALEAGIGMVHQEFSLIPGFTATDNILLNREPKKKNIISEIFGDRLDTLDYKEMAERSEQAIDKMGVKIDAKMVISDMPVGHKQFTEIARELSKDNLKLLILDEPTAVLTEKEAEALLDSIRGMAAKGIAVIFITHRLHEILTVCDKVVIMRDGYVVKDVPAKETDVADITKWMVGRNIQTTARADIRINPDAKNIMSIRNLWVDMSGETVRNVDLDIKEGETSPPKRYSSGSMILAMENAGQLIEDEELRAQIKGSGIGTSATRAEILKKLFNIKYMALNEKTQVITPTYLGELIYEVVHTSMKQLLNPELTASWEKGLTYVAEGSITPDEYMQKLERFVIGRTYNAVHMGNAYGLRPAFDAVAVFYQNAEKEKKSSRSAKSAGNMKAARATKAGTK